MILANEIDGKAAAWLSELCARGHLPDMTIDARDIQLLNGSDLDGYTQVHLFAGIGGWPLALELAGWPREREVWTGSCPCQPFSVAGKRKGASDERDLWPEMFRLIKERRPATIFGEQVASADVVGTQLEADFLVAVQTGEFARANKLAKRLAQSRAFHYHPRWLTRIRSDLASIGYSLRWKVLGAHSVGAPQIRQRLYWVADRSGFGRKRIRQSWGRGAGFEDDGAGYGPIRLADAAGGETLAADARQLEPRDGGAGDAGRLGDAESARPSRSRPNMHVKRANADGAGDPWRPYTLIPCRDPKRGIVHRRVPTEPAFQPLAARLPARVVRLRGYGNSIVPQVGAAFVKAFLETEMEKSA